MICLCRAVPEEATAITEIVVDAFAEEVKANGCAPRGYDSPDMRRKCMSTFLA